MSAVEPDEHHRPRVPVMTVVPADPEQMAIGGIASFVRGFVKFAPDDFDISFVGVSAARQPWTWHTVGFEGRQMAFLPVVRVDSRRRSPIPIAVRFAAALSAHPRLRRRLIHAERVVTGFHRPASDVGLGRWVGPRWRVVHLSVQDLTTAGSESRWRRGAALLQMVERRSFGRMDRIYAVNREVAQQYRARFPEVAERIRFIPNWADPTIFRPLSVPERARQRASLRGQLNLSDEAAIVLFAGRLEGQKDPLLLARAFSRLRATSPAAHLVVAGDGELAGAMRSELAGSGELPAARLVGVVSRTRLAELMNASDVLAITSAFETGPTVGLEALACGLPVVTTPVGEVARLVATSGAGAVTADRSPAAMARALSEVLTRRETEPLMTMAVSAAEPFLADRVLGPLYEENRRLAGQLPAGERSTVPARARAARA